MKPGFRAWLEHGYPPSVVGSRLANCRRVERYYGDLDLLYGTQRMTSLLSCLEYSTDDERHGRTNPSKIPIDGDLRTGLATLQSAVGLYTKFREGKTIGGPALTGPTPVTGTSRPATRSAQDLSTTQLQSIEPRAPRPAPRVEVVNGDESLLSAANDLEIDLPRLVAKCAIWVDPAVFHAHKRQHPHAAWYPNCRRGRKGEPAKGMMDGVRFDNNSWANLAIKVAVFGSREGCINMHACHLWPETCYDARYHTSLANLILLPAPLAGLSDHHKGVAQCLQYRSYEVFGWHPEEVPAPVRPAGYPSDSDWVPFLPIPRNIRRKFAI